MIKIQNAKKQAEAGNVLFLILIAVALFAALSYAVTQSTRTGGGSGDNETALISSAQLTQYPASVRTSVVRMVIGGVDIADVEFNAPSEFEDCADGTDFEFCVFHPNGGGATYAFAPSEMMASSGGNVQGQWVFNGENQIDLLGTTDSGGPTPGTADVIAFLPGITLTLCNRINEELGLPTALVTETGIDIVTQMINTDGTSPTGIGAGGETIGDESGDSTLDAQPFGCFQQPAGRYTYYHVLIER